MINKLIKRFKNLDEKQIKSDSDKLQLEMISLALKFKQIYEGSGGNTLDFTIESVKNCESYMGGLFEAINKKEIEFSDYEFDMTCFMVGAYLGEILILMFGGEWHKDEDGVPYYHRVNGEDWDSLFPVRKIAKRLTNGEEDDIYHFMVVALENLE